MNQILLGVVSKLKCISYIKAQNPVTKPCYFRDYQMGKQNGEILRSQMLLDSGQYIIYVRNFYWKKVGVYMKVYLCPLLYGSGCWICQEKT